jgi:hypothetical protein
MDQEEGKLTIRTVGGRSLRGFSSTQVQKQRPVKKMPEKSRSATQIIDNGRVEGKRTLSRSPPPSSPTKVSRSTISSREKRKSASRNAGGHKQRSQRQVLHARQPTPPILEPSAIDTSKEREPQSRIVGGRELRALAPGTERASPPAAASALEHAKFGGKTIWAGMTEEHKQWVRDQISSDEEEKDCAPNKNNNKKKKKRPESPVKTKWLKRKVERHFKHMSRADRQSEEKKMSLEERLKCQ